MLHNAILLYQGTMHIQSYSVGANRSRYVEPHLLVELAVRRVVLKLRRLDGSRPRTFHLLPMPRAILQQHTQQQKEEKATGKKGHRQNDA